MRTNYLMSVLKIMKFKIGSQVWSEGDRAKKIYLVLDGEFEINKEFIRVKDRFTETKTYLHFLRYWVSKQNAKSNKVQKFNTKPLVNANEDDRPNFENLKKNLEVETRRVRTPFSHITSDL